MRDLLPCPPCGRQGRPGKGTWQAPYHEPRGSAPRERDHRGGDHPVPSRTRQLSPPSPRVLQREAAGGQGVALAEGAFLFAPREARRGDRPCGPSRIWRQSGFTMLAAPCRQSIPRGLSSFRQPCPAGLRAHRILKSRGGISFAAFFAFWGVERPARG